MASIKIEDFSGIVPRLGPANLQPNQAQIASNVKLASGELRSWYSPLQVSGLTAIAQLVTAYKFYGPVSSNPIWLQWTSDVDVVPGPVADTSEYRLYFTSSAFAPRKTNFALASNNGAGSGPFPSAWYEMGVPAPTGAPSLAASALTANAFVLVTSSQISTLTSNQVIRVTIDGSTPTLITILPGGSGAINATSLQAQLSSISTLTATVNSNNELLITSKTSGASSAVLIEQQTGTTANYVYYAIANSALPSVAIETRAYVYTYVTQFGAVSEESAPSPYASVSCHYSGDSVTVSGFATPPSGNYNFQYKRIYRTVVGASSTNYQFVAQIPISQTSYVDTQTTANLGAVLSSTYYTPPPASLKGIVSIANGMLAGFTGNEIWFCEPYIPHAWPSTYTLTTDYPIVGLCAFEGNLVVLTTKQPYTVSGSSPANMTQTKLPILEPCVSKKSIVSDEMGVLYASPNGLVLIGQGLGQVITTSLFTRDEWQLLNPSSMVSAIYNKMYIGFYQAGSVKSSVVIKRQDTPPLVTLDYTARSTFFEQSTANLYVVSDVTGNVYQLDAVNTNATYTWKSKKFVLPTPMNFGALQVHGDYSSGGSVSVSLIADGTTVYTVAVSSEQPVRLPATARAYNWEILLTGSIPIRSVAIANTMADIKGA